MSISRYILIVLALSFIVAFPYKAYSHKHIPFYVTYPKEKGAIQLEFNCVGPWLRTSGNLLVDPGADHVKFYSAEVTIFSPFGKWSCTTCIPNPGAPICQRVAKVDFHLYKDDDEVSLTMTKDSLSVHKSDDTDTLSAHATLGDDNNKPKRDRDTFSFQGTEGDSVLVTLEEDPESGHIGEEATLILRDGANGSFIREIITGALPIEIMATLPVSGEYELVVEQHGIPIDLRYRGNYFLSIESASGEIQEIRPSEDVEQ